MPVDQIDPDLIRSNAAAGSSTDLLAAIDLIILTINQIIDGGTGLDGQVFRYTATGSEANPVTISLPSTWYSQADLMDYNVQITMGGPSSNTMKIARALVSTFTNSGFDVETSATLEAGDILMFTVERNS